MEDTPANVLPIRSRRFAARKREDIMTSVWGYTTYLGDVRAVDVAIRRLRMKIEDDPSDPQFIMTRRGIGYYFETQ